MKSSFQYLNLIFKNHLVCFLLVILLTGCKATGMFSIEQQITMHGLSKQYIKVNQFNIMYLSNDRSGTTLHVYLEGDGRPWMNRHSISPDPTPKSPLALSLMTQDLSNAIYLSRPCYHLIKPDSKCSADLWTNARYSETIVEAMLLAVKRIIASQKTVYDITIDNVVFIGYSGGGVLATLLAERLSLAKIYVTIAANLDTKRWTEHHQFSPLIGSINPFDFNRPKYKLGLHFVGSNDLVVPPQTTQHFIEKTAGKRVVLQSFGHNCCWIEHWTKLLSQIKNFQQKTN